MAKHVVKSRVKYKGTIREPGTVLDLSAEVAAPLVEAGVIDIAQAESADKTEKGKK